MEWSSLTHDLLTVSIHTYERAPQIVIIFLSLPKLYANIRIRRQISSDQSKFVGQLRVDPQSRCVALSLPHDALAILPLYQSQIDLDLMDVDQTMARFIFRGIFLRQAY